MLSLQHLGSQVATGNLLIDRHIVVTNFPDYEISKTHTLGQTSS